jgi:tRNA(Ile)-lysidine synthase
MQLDLNFLKQFNTLFIACSGGVDSIVLTHLLAKQHLPITVLHCNFNLRGAESNLDEDFVRLFCEENKISFDTISFDTLAIKSTKKIAIQELARELRYNWFQTKLNSTPNSIVCTAHHKDDNREQFLLRLLSSGKLVDLSGIPLQREGYYRPLLTYSKAEIIAYAEKEKLTWREDASNVENKYTRNSIRNQLIPELLRIDKRALSSIDKSLTEISTLKREINNQIDNLFKQLSNRQEFFIQPSFWERQLTLYKELFLTEWMQTPILLSEIDKIFKHSKVGAKVELNDFYILKEKEGLWFGRHSHDTTEPIDLTKHINSTLQLNDCTIHINESSTSNSCENMNNANNFSFEIDSSTPLLLRNAKSGEYIHLGEYKKKYPLQKELINKKTPHYIRKKLLVIEQNNEIILVPRLTGALFVNKKENKNHSKKLCITVLFSNFDFIQ